MKNEHFPSARESPFVFAFGRRGRHFSRIALRKPLCAIVWQLRCIASQCGQYFQSEIQIRAQPSESGKNEFESVASAEIELGSP